MEKYFKSKSTTNLPSSSTLEDDNNNQVSSISKKSRVEVNLANLSADPGVRSLISSYHPNDRDEVRRAYLQKGPCQPHDHKFPYTQCGQDKRRFNPTWFKDYGSWLEYSIEKDAAFCLCCYLFGEQAHSDTFATKGFKNWKKKEKLEQHVGGLNNAHNQAYQKSQALLNQKQHIQTIFEKQSNQERQDYRIRLKATLECIRFLLHQGLAFRGHDESKGSRNKGNFLELLNLIANQNAFIKKVALQNAPENLKLISPKIQKDIVSATALETTQAIIYELGDSPFALLVDEAHDISMKEQMAIVLRYADKCGRVIEHFLALEHVTNTTAQSLKAAIDGIFSKHGLSISNLRGQGYDGASNMRGELNGLKALSLNENPTAFYIHCFAHQLQLALVAVAKKHPPIYKFFDPVSNVLNVVGASCKQHDMLQNIQAAKVLEALTDGELKSGHGLNQETRLKRPGDTSWGSHYDTLVSLILMFSFVVDVLDIISKDDTSEHMVTTSSFVDTLESFDFVFKLHLIRDILGITNELSKALQRKDQDIVNAMELVKVSKERLQMMRDNGWDSLLTEVHSFCERNEIIAPKMNDMFMTHS